MMFIILTVIVLSGWFIYILLKPPRMPERTVRIARRVPVNKQSEYELNLMSVSHVKNSRE